VHLLAREAQGEVASHAEGGVMTDAPACYEDLKALAAALNRRLESMHALAGANDPFMAGLPSRRRAAEWFTALWRRLRFQSGMHVRRIHYALVSQAKPVRCPDGTDYENTERCWIVLKEAARDARFLGLIPTGAIVDRRNPDPVINRIDEADSTAVIHATGGVLIGSTFNIERDTSLALPELILIGPTIGQRFHVELWCEKSTMNDILLPIGQRFGVNVITGVGEMSATQCEQLVERALDSDRPVRLLYVSDFDPGGMSMPVAVARKVEFLIRDHPNLDIQVRPIALTHAQSVQYRLPRIPIKDTDRRAAHFESRFGEGATELDALEALHPGILRQVVETEIDRYFDRTLNARISRVTAGVQTDLDAITEEVHARYARQIASLEKKRERIVVARERMQERIARLEGAIEESAEPILDAIRTELQAAQPDIHSYDWPEPAEGDEEPNPLFDSTRSYLDQVDAYRAHQGKTIDEAMIAVTCTCQRCGRKFTATRCSAKFCSASCRARAGYHDRRSRGAKR
jgi:hypothetical protein